MSKKGVKRIDILLAGIGEISGAFFVPQNQGAQRPVDIGSAPTGVERRGGNEWLAGSRVLPSRSAVDTSYGGLREVSFTLKEF